ncbi:MAG: tetraacyldisaccharide 4'-kinase [Rhodocyclaceae bacterium]
MSLESTLRRAWFSRGPLACSLAPLAAGFGALVALRRALYVRGILRCARLPVPVIVVGNLAVGGTGKTPLAILLARELARRGMHPGVVSRGYGRVGGAVREVGPRDDAARSGDEPLLIARRTGMPVWIGADRVAAGRALIARHPECDVVISDDGLQHYRLARDVEIALVDERAAGNGWLLPAGPLREPASRLASVDAVVIHGEGGRAPVPAGPARFSMSLEGSRFFRLDAPGESCTAQDLRGLRLHAVAGIGAPRRFFDHLARLGLSFAAHPFPDHHRYSAQDLRFAHCDAILMTEKDAVKCAGLTPGQCWVLPVDAVVRPDLADFVVERIDGREAA